MVRTLKPRTEAPVANPVTIDECVPLWEASLSTNTARGWRTYSNLLQTHFRGRKFDDVFPGEITALRDSVMASAQERQVSRTGRSAGEAVVTASRSLWKWAIANGRASRNPASDVSKPSRAPAMERRHLTFDELQLMWDALATGTRDPTLAILVFRLALETGLRRGEMLALTRKSMLGESQCIEVKKGKGMRQRRVPVTPNLWEALELFWERRSGNARPTTPLLIKRSGEPITERWFEYHAELVRKRVPQLGPEGEVWFTWHLLRHTGAVWMERHAGFAVAQAFLGHTPRRTRGNDVTHTYVAATFAEVRRSLHEIWQVDGTSTD